MAIFRDIFGFQGYFILCRLSPKKSLKFFLGLATYVLEVPGICLTSQTCCTRDGGAISAHTCLAQISCSIAQNECQGWTEGEIAHAKVTTHCWKGPKGISTKGTRRNLLKVKKRGKLHRIRMCRGNFKTGT